MREAARRFSAEDEVRILARYIHLRRQLDLPRIYNHSQRPQFYRVGERWYRLGQLAQLVADIETGRKVAA